jgi:nucleotide-binding universal stress UspA family protein
MPVNQNILVVINPTKDEQVALNKAIRISASLSTKITVLVRSEYATPKTLAPLEQKLNNAKASGIEVAIEISDEKNWLLAISDADTKIKFDLIVKEPHEKSLADHIFLPDDWKLLRSSRCPVLLVHADNDWDNNPILLCVNANVVDHDHQALNKQILAAGRMFAEAADVQINVASSYPSAMQAGSKHDQAPELQKDKYHRNCQELLANYDIVDAKIHIEQGPTELMIPELADKLNAKVVVLGTVARSGLSGFLLGNTAEQIINRLTTDILVLPPKK